MIKGETFRPFSVSPQNKYSSVTEYLGFGYTQIHDDSTFKNHPLLLILASRVVLLLLFLPLCAPPAAGNHFQTISMLC